MADQKLYQIIEKSLVADMLARGRHPIQSALHASNCAARVHTCQITSVAKYLDYFLLDLCYRFHMEDCTDYKLSNVPLHPLDSHKLDLPASTPSVSEIVRAFSRAYDFPYLYNPMHACSCEADSITRLCDGPFPGCYFLKRDILDRPKFPTEDED